MTRPLLGVLPLIALLSMGTHASIDTKHIALPEAAVRSYAQNYRDMALAFCLELAYSSDPHANADAMATAGALDNWSNYDAESSAGELRKLAARYLARDYQSIQGPAVKLDLLKCIDMYHSKELGALVRRYVRTPNRTYQQDVYRRSK